jgi:lipocalin-like protein
VKKVMLNPGISGMCKMLFLALIGLVFAFRPVQAQATQKQIIGAWSVVSVVVTDVNGKTFEPYGPHAQGQFIFTADGHFSVNITRPGRPKFASNNRMAGTPEENKEAFSGSLGFFGTYAINPGGEVTMRVIGCSFPNWEGAEQKRTVQIVGAEMKLIDPHPSSGSGTAVVMLRRAK